MSSRFVAALQHRFEFVKKEDSEVGAGTDFPLLATLDNVAEIFYRVKDMMPYSGYVSGTDGSTTHKVELLTPPSSLPARVGGYYPSSGEEYMWKRGYAAYYDLVWPLPADYFGEPYDVEVFYDYGLGSVLTERFADVGDNEHALWVCYDEEASGYPPVLDGITAFDFEMEQVLFIGTSNPVGHGWEFSSVTPGPTTQVWNDGLLFVAIGKRVAWVDDDGSGNPISPGNRIYIEAQCKFEHYAYGLDISTRSADFVSPGPEELGVGIDFKLELASGVILRCPFYIESGLYSSYGGDGLLFKALQWWPYKKPAEGNAGSQDAWNPDDGTKL